MSDGTNKTGGNEMVKLAGVLLIITVVVAGLLGYVNAITAPKIADNDAKKVQEALAALMPDAKFDEGKDITDNADGVTKLYTAEGGAGYCVQVDASGFGGIVQMLVGINTDGTVAGISILSHSETPGLGAKASEPEFSDQFKGATADGELAVTKDGGTIQAISGATITSRAVTNAVNAAAKYVTSLSSGGDTTSGTTSGAASGMTSGTTSGAASGTTPGTTSGTTSGATSGTGAASTGAQTGGNAS